MKLSGHALIRTGGAAVALLLLSACAAAIFLAGNCARPKEAPSMTVPPGQHKATFAAGCFWGVEAAFRKIDGVTGTQVGYTGGLFASPTYQDVCSDKTGHAEAVQVAFDPARVSYERLLEVFWGCHDPTTADRQGPDVGSQYRSAIFYHTPAQAAAARASKEALASSGRYAGRSIVTQILPAPTFWPAEDYHQQYLEKRGLASCHSGLK